MSNKSIWSASIKSTKGKASIPDKPGWIPQSSCKIKTKIIKALIIAHLHSTSTYFKTKMFVYHDFLAFEFEHDTWSPNLLSGTPTIIFQQNTREYYVNKLKTKWHIYNGLITSKSLSSAGTGTSLFLLAIFFLQLLFQF